MVTGVSSSQSGYGSEAFRWKNGVMTGLGDLPGGAFWSNARDVSGNGLVIVGGAYSAAHSREAFRWTEGEGMVALGTLSGNSFAQAVSADGSVVVGWSAASYLGMEAFVWDAGHGMRRLSQVLSSLGLDLTDWRLASANDVSADGNTIVGSAFHTDGRREAYVARIPEPATLVLLALGALLATGRRR
ncbi:MAG: PEP-CTERM sorting domain-containing protein [Planctomycetes bacterium]|nr:PEP-CTERM sorting domain-containing protein [Planctomycetota bacterium]